MLSRRQRAEQCEKQFADRGLVEYATRTAKELYGQLPSDPPGSTYEDIPF